MGKNKPFEVPVDVSIAFYFAKPAKSKFKYHGVKPDLDNCIKLLLDSANNICWRDDCLIRSLRASKVYTDEEPKTVLIIREIDEDLQSRDIR